MIKALVVVILLAIAFLVGTVIYEMWKDLEPPTIRPKFVEEYTTTGDEDSGSGSSNSNTSGGSTSGASSGSHSQTSSAPAASSNLPGMPPYLEASYAQAKSQGAQALRVWIFNNRSKVKDPRLADIQLDYVVLVAPDNLLEARKTYAQVKQRVDPSSPVYPRLKALAKTYE